MECVGSRTWGTREYGGFHSLVDVYLCCSRLKTSQKTRRKNWKVSWCKEYMMSFITQPPSHVAPVGTRGSIILMNFTGSDPAVTTRNPWRASSCSAKTWVAVKERKLSYYIGETLLFAI